MKKICYLVIMLCIISSGALATFRFNAGDGSWADTAMWDKGFPPLTTTEELKITRANNICRVNSYVGVYTAAPRVSIANAESTPATVIIEGDGYLSVGEFRVGAGGATGEGSTGMAEQTGGTLSVSDCYVSRYGGSLVAKGYYTISGGTLTFNSGANGRLFVGTGVGGGYTEGTLTIVGNGATIQMDTLYVGGEGTNYGSGTVEFEVGASGVSPIQLSDLISLDALGAQSTANVIVSTTQTTLADTDILLITNSSSAAVAGQFDSFNGGPATEGTEVVLANNIYSLTYQYTANDIALVYEARVNERPHFPSPADAAVLGTSPLTLSWTNPDPNNGVGSITPTVYFGTDPNVWGEDSKLLAPNAASVAINTENFPTFGAQPLTNNTIYYWAVACYDPSSGPEPFRGRVWSFTTDYNSEPSVDAGADQATWLGRSGTAGQEVVQLNATVIDDGRPTTPGVVTLAWTQDSGPTVSIVPANAEDPSITFMEAGTYVFTLTADDGEKQSPDTVELVIGVTACDASHRSTGAAYAAGDSNRDCLVNLEDFAALIAVNWLDCTDTQTNCGN